MTKHESYAYGWAYGVMETAIDATGTPYDNSGVKCGMAAMRPMTGNAEIILAARRAGVLSGELEEQVMAALCEINAPGPGDGPEPVQPAENQGAWDLGRAHARSGRPLHVSAADAYDIAAHRRNAGLTQKELADAVGVSLETVTRWETQGMIPRPAKLRKIREVLGG